MEIRKLNPSDIEGLRKVHAIAYNFRTDFANLEKDPLHDPADWIWGCFERGTLVTAIGAIPYKMRFDGHTAGMFGIGGVATLPEARRGGKVFAIFRQIFEEEYEKGTEFSNLTPFSHSFYRRMGYELCNCRHIIKTSVRNFDIHPQRGSFTQHFPGDPLDELNEIFNKYIKNLNHAIPRDCQPDMRLWKKFTNNDPYKTGVCTYIWRDGGEAKGYIKIFQDRDAAGNLNLTLHELAFVDPDSMYGTLSLLSLLQGDELTWQAPAFTPISDIIPENWKYKVSIQPRDMTRVVHVENALKLMRRPAGRGGYRIEVIDKQIPQNNGVFQVEYDESGSGVGRVGGEPDLTAEIPAISQLMTGFRGLDNALMGRADLKLHKNVETLRQVFTARPSHLTEEF